MVSYGRGDIATLFLCLGTAALQMTAQVTTSTIAGVVTDGAGGAVPNVRVIATVSSTGQQCESTTNDTGEYVVPQLAPGSYNIAVSATGFQTAVVQNVALNIAERSTSCP
jgi:phosphatidate phosphatase APP1